MEEDEERIQSNPSLFKCVDNKDLEILHEAIGSLLVHTTDNRLDETMLWVSSVQRYANGRYIIPDANLQTHK